MSHHFAETAGPARYRSADEWRRRAWAWHEIMLMGIIIVIATLVSAHILNIGQECLWLVLTGVGLSVVGYNAATDADNQAG